MSYEQILELPNILDPEINETPDQLPISKNESDQLLKRGIFWIVYPISLFILLLLQGACGFIIGTWINDFSNHKLPMILSITTMILILILTPISIAYSEYRRKNDFIRILYPFMLIIL